MDADHSSQLFNSYAGKFVELIARVVPILLCLENFLLGKQPLNWDQVIGEMGALTKPAGLCPGKGGGDPQHVELPSSIKPSSPFSPIHIPVPYRWEDEQGKCEIVSV